MKTIHEADIRKKVRFALLGMLILALASPMSAAPVYQQIDVTLGHSAVIEYSVPVKRISIADPEVADATVANPTQIIINGKTIGSTSLIVWDETEAYIIYTLTVRSTFPQNQVMLRVRFAEVNKAALQEFGLDFLVKNRELNDDIVSLGSFAGQVSMPNDPLLLSENVDFFLAIPTRNVSAVIQALEERNLLTTLAKPNLTAMNGGEASFLAGGEFPVPIAQGGIGLGMVTIQFKEFGIRLKFVPTISDSNLINIKVTTEVSSLDFENGIELAGFKIPSLITRRTETAVELQNGNHFILGGLISQEMIRTLSKVPILGDIPVLKYLFSNTRFINRETELIIMITPYIIDSTGKQL